jgi:hypothetical protein
MAFLTNPTENAMKKVIVVSSLCSLVLGCASVPEPNQELARQLAHCGLVADNLAKSDPKYKQSASTFLGAAGVLASNRSVVNMMVEDTPRVTGMQKAEKEKTVEECQSLLYSNMDKVGAAMSQPKNH